MYNEDNQGNQGNQKALHLYAYSCMAKATGAMLALHLAGEEGLRGSDADLDRALDLVTEHKLKQEYAHKLYQRYQVVKQLSQHPSNRLDGDSKAMQSEAEVQA